jgi:hypothetical protein
MRRDPKINLPLTLLTGILDSRKKKHFKEIIQEKINNSTNNFVFVLFSWRKAVPII